jgi:hypothetical protein
VNATSASHVWARTVLCLKICNQARLERFEVTNHAVVQLPVDRIPKTLDARDRFGVAPAENCVRQVDCRGHLGKQLFKAHNVGFTVVEYSFALFRRERMSSANAFLHLLLCRGGDAIQAVVIHGPDQPSVVALPSVGW